MEARLEVLIRLSFGCMLCWFQFMARSHGLDRGTQLTDLRTRKTGSDWQGFLGPTGDGKSPEKGLHLPWPKIWAAGCLAQTDWYRLCRTDSFPRDDCSPSIDTGITLV